MINLSHRKRVKPPARHCYAVMMLAQEVIKPDDLHYFSETAEYNKDYKFSVAKINKSTQSLFGNNIT